MKLEKIQKKGEKMGKDKFGEAKKRFRRELQRRKKFKKKMEERRIARENNPSLFKLYDRINDNFK